MGRYERVTQELTDVSWETIPDGRSSWTETTSIPNDKLHRVTENRLVEANRSEW